MPNYYETPKYDSNLLFRLLINNEGMSVRPHYHPDIEIIIVIEGALKLMIENSLFSIKENNFILIPSNNIHFTLPDKKNIHLVFQFSPKMFDQIDLLNKIMTEIKAPVLSSELSSRSKELIQNKFEIIRTEWLYKKNGFNIVIEAILQELLIYIGRELSLFTVEKPLNSGTKIKNSSKFISDVVHYIDEHYSEKVTLDAISTHVNLSKYYFSRIIKKHLGMSFTDYLTHYRINRAQFILSETQKNVEEVGYLVGYRYTQSFYKSFKKVTGMSPNEYRKWIS